MLLDESKSCIYVNALHMQNFIEIRLFILRIWGKNGFWT